MSTQAGGELHELNKRACKQGVNILNASSVIFVGLTLLVGLMLGTLLSGWWSRHKAVTASAAFPTHWPLQARMVVNDSENRVWHGLKSIFHDHMVIVKIPVLRYTKFQDAPLLKTASGPDSKEHRAAQLVHGQWLGWLSGVYTTFTVCTLSGKVVGCVDVPSSKRFSKSSSEMKEALLLHCGIAYAVADALTTADTAKMRELFLGEMPLDSSANQVTRGGDSNFYSELTSFTQHDDAFR